MKEIKKKRHYKYLDRFCSHCGKPCKKTISEIKKSKSGNVFCCRSCAISYNNSKFRTKENNPNWRGGISKTQPGTKIAFRTYIPKCVICGNEEKCCLQAHHIDKNRKNNASENMIILCANCHCRIHYGGFEITDEIINKRDLLKKPLDNRS